MAMSKPGPARAVPEYPAALVLFFGFCGLFTMRLAISFERTQA